MSRLSPGSAFLNEGFVQQAIERYYHDRGFTHDSITSLDAPLPTVRPVVPLSAEGADY